MKLSVFKCIGEDDDDDDDDDGDDYTDDDKDDQKEQKKMNVNSNILAYEAYADIENDV